MLRSILGAVKHARTVGLSNCSSAISNFTSPQASLTIINRSQFTGRSYTLNNCNFGTFSLPTILSSLKFLQPKPLQVDTVRSVIKFSKSGKRKTVKLVLQKFYRLHWGCWIRTKAGRHKKLFKKSANRRRRLQYHVFCNGQQSHLLDKMVTRYWRKPRFYVDDPYEPYHSREEYCHSRRKPYQPFA
ncbi:39S ribosomal protein L35, mitochondrial isoform X2 [Macrosteles quadrilineatus]|uniref:39S ribosomal protein L35, mitochondrial isoform X2 n=1 Tax=Macrosteles quadrilineatus TaxID=74068 RepID=UPI0023E229CA|nr:39S ribosomal protein L35, mitochondrial isoform X2 [Macrosteles quadrilineatus]